MNKHRLSQLSFEEKKQLLAKAREGKVSSPKHQSKEPFSRYPKDKPIPTSVIQQEIWFHETLVKNSNAYNIPIAMEIHGELNKSALEQAFQAVIAKYEILRTSFYTIGGIPHQKVSDHLDFKINSISLIDTPEPLREQKSMDLLFRYSKESFALDQTPLLRVFSFDLAPHSCILLFVIHHLLCDNWSLTLLIQEILTLFNSISAGIQPDESSPKIQYSDYCFWEKEMLASEETKLKMDYLRNKLRSFNSKLNLPYDLPPNHNERTEAKSKQFVIANDDINRITKTCQSSGITPYIFFLTVYHALLYRYTFQKKIVVGTSFLNRPSEDETGLMGPFINVALIDSTINTDTTFEVLANQIKNTVLEMHSFRFIPLNKMIKSINNQARKDLSLTQVFFGFLNFKINQISHTSTNTLTVKLLNQSNELRVYNTAKFELDLTIWEDENNMGGSLEYMSNVFNEETISLLIEHYKQICHQMSVNMKLKLQDMDLYDPLRESSSGLETVASFTFE